LRLVPEESRLFLVEEKEHFLSTQLIELNYDDGFGPPYGGGAVFLRGGFSYRYEPDPDAVIEYGLGGYPMESEIEYYVAAVDESRLTSWTLDDYPDLLLRLLSLPRHHPEDEGNPWIKPDAILAFLNEFGALTLSSLRDDSDPESEIFWNLGDGRNANFMFNFSETVMRLRYAVEDVKEGDLISLVAALDESPAPSLYRALLLQLLDRLVEGRPAPRPCEGCGKWFFETENESTAVHRTGWKRRDARFHSYRCMKAAHERKRRARLKDRSAPTRPALTPPKAGRAGRPAKLPGAAHRGPARSKA
jgi:hypothetical protein